MWMLKGWAACFVLSVFFCTVARCCGINDKIKAENERAAFLASLNHEQRLALAIVEDREKREAELRRRAEKEPVVAEKIRFPGLEASAAALPECFPKARKTDMYSLDRVFDAGFLLPLSEKEAVVAFLKAFSGEEPRVGDGGWIFFYDVRRSHVGLREVADPAGGETVLLVSYSFPRADPNALK